MRPDDKPAVVAALNDPECGRFLWRPPFPYAGADFDGFYAYLQTAWRADHMLSWIVAGADDDAALASISLELSPLTQTGELGYWCAPWARRRGVMKAAVRLLRDWAFDYVGLRRLEIVAHPDNTGSQRTALAAGFEREGVMRGLSARHGRADHVLFAMLTGDPRPGPGQPRPRQFGWPQLEDGRLLVRPFEPDDAPAVQAGCDDADLARWIYRLPSPYSPADAQAFVTDARRRLVAGESARLAVEDAATGELLGSVGLSRFADRQAAEIGYWVKREARRRGVALRRRASSSPGPSTSSASSASSCSPIRATRPRRPWPAGSGSPARACSAATSRPSPARAVRGVSCRLPTAASRPATTR